MSQSVFLQGRQSKYLLDPLLSLAGGTSTQQKVVYSATSARVLVERSWAKVRESWLKRRHSKHLKMGVINSKEWLTERRN
jgi:hypothetical protein